MNGRDGTTKALLALQYVEELSNKRKRALLDAAPLAQDMSKSLVRSVLGDENAEAFYRNLQRADAIIERLCELDIDYVTCYDDEFPELLADIDDSPIMLFLKGNVGALKNPKIGIVGTRRPTRYGSRVADEFARQFARSGLTVVSGFARGIDGIAHKACVDEGKPTIAVFACGLDVCYPAEHRSLMDGILDAGGLLVSEYPLGSKPLQYHFPERNRLISGLSRGVLLAEAAKKSGSLITMRLAVEQGRDIYAVPANIYSPESSGSNALLREMPHALVISPEDVLSAMGVKAGEQDREVVELSIVEHSVMEALHDGELHFEQLLAATGLDVSELTNVLFNLQLNGLIDDMGGNYYALH